MVWEINAHKTTFEQRHEVSEKASVLMFRGRVFPLGEMGNKKGEVSEAEKEHDRVMFEE